MGDLTDKSGNVSIHNESTDTAVTTTTDSANSKERLDVNALLNAENHEQQEGGQKKVWTHNDATEVLLGLIYKTLLRMEKHLYSMTDERIDNNDID